MDNLEKDLFNLPKAKLSHKADFKIKFKIYRFLFLSRLAKLKQSLFHPHSLLARISYVSLLILVVLGSTAVYAASNDHITTGDTFYPLKKTIENVEQQLSLTKKSQVDTLNKLSERRLKEAVNLVQDDLKNKADQDSEVISNNIQDTINAAVDNVDSAVKTSQKIENKDKAKEVKEKIKKQNEEMIKYLEHIEDINKDEDQKVSAKVDEAKEKIRQLSEELEKEDRHEIRDNDKKRSERSKQKNEEKRSERTDKDNEDDRD